MNISEKTAIRIVLAVIAAIVLTACIFFPGSLRFFLISLIVLFSNMIAGSLIRALFARWTRQSIDEINAVRRAAGCAELEYPNE